MVGALSFYKQIHISVFNTVYPLEIRLSGEQLTTLTATFTLFLTPHSKCMESDEEDVAHLGHWIFPVQTLVLVYI